MTELRDPKRIKEFCDYLAKVWEDKCPDWRFGQFVENVCRANGVGMIFFPEEEQWITYINRTFGIGEDVESEVE